VLAHGFLLFVKRPRDNNLQLCAASKWVLTGTKSDHPVAKFRVAQLRKEVCSASEFKRSAILQILALEEEFQIKPFG
jgi:hypothetical protein